jgi:hypothetical protein
MASTIHQRSTSRTSIYSTSSSDQETGGSNTVLLSTLEPVSRTTRQQQSLGEIEMISNGGQTTKDNGTKETANNSQESTFKNNTPANNGGPSQFSS